MSMEADLSENWEYPVYGPSEGGWIMIDHEKKSCRIGKAYSQTKPHGCVRAKPCSSGKTWAKRVWTPLEGAAPMGGVYRWVYHCYWKGHFREVFVDFDPRHPVNLLECVMVYDKHWQALTNNIEWDHRDGDRWVTSRLDELLRQLSNPESEREQSLAESRELLRHGIALGLMMALMVKQCTFSDMVPWSDESMQFKWEFIECRANLLVSNSVVLEFRCFIAASLWICLWQERLMFTYFYPGACLRRSWWMLLPPGKTWCTPANPPFRWSLKRLQHTTWIWSWRTSAMKMYEGSIALLWFSFHCTLDLVPTRRFMFHLCFHVPGRSCQAVTVTGATRFFSPGVRGPEIFSPWWQPKSQRKELGCPGRCCNWCQPWSVTFSICWFCCRVPWKVDNPKRAPQHTNPQFRFTMFRC